MIVAIVGNVRTGKTLFATIIAYSLHKAGYKIYSNYKTTFSDKIISPLEVLEFEINDGVMLLDEVGTIIDSRNNSLANRLFSYFLNQSGKRDVHIIYTSQYRKLYDLRLDTITHIMFKASRNPDEFIYKKYKNTDTGLKFQKRILMPVDKASKYYSMYETKEVIYSPDLSSANMMDFKDIKSKFKESPTKQSFKILMRKLNPYASLDTFGAVYDYLKNGNEEMARKILGDK